MCALHSGVLPSSQASHHSVQWCRAMLHLQGKDGEANGASEAKPAADPELEAARKAERERRAAKVNSRWLTSSTILLQVNHADAKAQTGHQPLLLQSHGCSLVPFMRKCRKSKSSRCTCNAQAAAQEEPLAAAAVARGKHNKLWPSAVCVLIKAVSALQCPETANCRRQRWRRPRLQRLWREASAASCGGRRRSTGTRMRRTASWRWRCWRLQVIFTLSSAALLAVKPFRRWLSWLLQSQTMQSANAEDDCYIMLLLALCPSTGRA